MKLSELYCRIKVLNWAGSAPLFPGEHLATASLYLIVTTWGQGTPDVCRVEAREEDSPTIAKALTLLRTLG